MAVDVTHVVVPSDVAVLQEGKQRVTYTVLTGENWEMESEYTISLKDGIAGVNLVPFPRILSAPQRPVKIALSLAFREAWTVSYNTVIGIGHLVSSIVRTGTVPEGIAGIVGIAQMTHASVQEGFMTYLRLVALLSLSLAILNILPFPALDGGRLIFVFAELIGRRPVNRRFELITNAFGFMFLIFLIVFITFHDVVRLFS